MLGPGSVLRRDGPVGVRESGSGCFVEALAAMVTGERAESARSLEHLRILLLSGIAYSVDGSRRLLRVDADPSCSSIGLEDVNPGAWMAEDVGGVNCPTGATRIGLIESILAGDETSEA